MPLSSPFFAPGSLISYFKAKQGADFYVKIYCAFYLPGLPISLLQQRYDEGVDRKLGSANAFMLRVLLGMAIKIGMLLYMPFVPFMFPQSQVPSVMLVCMVLVGAFTWMIHGTACQLCAMFPPSSIAYLQTGFRTPEIYTVLMVATLGLTGDVSRGKIIAFYYVTAMVRRRARGHALILAKKSAPLRFIAVAVRPIAVFPARVLRWWWWERSRGSSWRGPRRRSTSLPSRMRRTVAKGRSRSRSRFGASARRFSGTVGAVAMMVRALVRVAMMVRALVREATRKCSRTAPV